MISELKKKIYYAIPFFFNALILFYVLFTYNKNDASFLQADGSSEIVNGLGSFGAHIADFLFYFFGGAAFFLPVILSCSGFIMFFSLSWRYEWERIVALVILMVCTSFLCNYSGIDSGVFLPGGIIGKSFSQFVDHNEYGVAPVWFVFALTWACMIIITRLSLLPLVQRFLQTQWALLAKKLFFLSLDFIKNIYQLLQGAWYYVLGKNSEISISLPELSDDDLVWAQFEQHVNDQHKIDFEDEVWQKFRIIESKHHNVELESALYLQMHNKDSLQKKVDNQKPEDLKKVSVSAKLKAYRKPAISLLDFASNKSVKNINNEHKDRALIVEEKLAHFGVKGKIISMTPGPVVTLFEFQPEVNIKVSRILALENDLALALKAHSLRIIAPIPGKSVVGFEVANIDRETLLLSPLINSSIFKKSAAHVPIVLGHDTAGAPIIIDVVGAPHLLIAGSTGSGKSVALNVLLISMLYKCSPDELRLVLIDPKRLEFAGYADIPHLLCPIITAPNKAVLVLKWILKTMEERYEFMATIGVKNVIDYKKWCKENEKKDDMPFIVVMIDELADLMMVAGKDIEELLARIAQMARAAGIHLIVATQRPSVDVITGVIKVNFPSRIAFKVASKIDSRTILDSPGAEKLLGKGDMLYLGGDGFLGRVHGAYISSQEIEKVVSHVKAERPTDYLINLDEMVEKTVETSEEDPLYQEVLSFVKNVEEISISQLQRTFRIGYNRSARIIEKLESDQIISAPDGSKMRKVMR